ACTSLVTASWTVTPASAWDRGSVQTFAVLPEGVPKVEGLTVGGDGNVYVSTFDPTGPAAPSQLFVFDDNGKLLRSLTIAGSSKATLGLGFNPVTHQLLVIDFGAGKVLNVNPTTGSSSVFMTVTGSSGINGADGIVLDANDNIWVAANQADEIVVVDPTGKAIAKLGDFNGVKDGVTRGLLFPASPAFGKDGTSLFVTNLELDLTSIGLTQSVDSQWAAQVKRHSIAKLLARIPPISDKD